MYARITTLLSESTLLTLLLVRFGVRGGAGQPPPLLQGSLPAPRNGHQAQERTGNTGSHQRSTVCRPDVSITITSDARSFTLMFSSTASGSQSQGSEIPPNGSWPGFMRERTDRLGGALRAGSSGGRWDVKATVPLEPLLTDAPQANKVPCR